MPEVISADTYARALKLARLESLPMGDALDRIRNLDLAQRQAQEAKAPKRRPPPPGKPGKFPAAPPEDWPAEPPAGLYLPTAGDAELQRLAAGFPEATETEVGEECRTLLVTMGATRLDAGDAPPRIPAGTLVYMTTEHRGKPKGISSGAPDWWLARAGWWGWLGIELKRRGAGGRLHPEARISKAQERAFVSGLYAVCWCPAHLGLLIEGMDRRTGYRPAA